MYIIFLLDDNCIVNFYYLNRLSSSRSTSAVKLLIQTYLSNKCMYVCRNSPSNMSHSSDLRMKTNAQNIIRRSIDKFLILNTNFQNLFPFRVINFVKLTNRCLKKLRQITIFRNPKLVDNCLLVALTNLVLTKKTSADFFLIVSVKCNWNEL